MRTGSALRVLCGLSALFLFGCSDGSSNNNAVITPNPSAPLTLTTATATTSPGQPAVYNLTLFSSTVPASAINLSVTGLPANAASTFSPAQVALTSPSLRGTSTLTITPSANTPSGTYNLVIAGSVGQNSFGTIPATLIVQPTNVQQAFNLSVSPSNAFVGTNTPATYTVTVTALNGFNQPVTLTLSGGGNGYLVSGINPATLDLSNQPSATASFTVRQSGGAVPTSPVSLTVTATSGTITYSVNVTAQPQ